jgi:hypothetical protein
MSNNQQQFPQFPFPMPFNSTGSQNGISVNFMVVSMDDNGNQSQNPFQGFNPFNMLNNLGGMPNLLGGKG